MLLKGSTLGQLVSGKFDQPIQKGAHRRMGATTLWPNSRDIVPLHRKLRENRDQLLPLHPRSGHETRGHSYTRARRHGCQNSLACINDDRR